MDERDAGDKFEENLGKARVVRKMLDDGDLPLKEEEKSIAGMMTILGGNPTEFLVSAVSRNQAEEAERENPEPEHPGDYTDVERALAEMVTENTGTHMLDSGGAYGRRWERNRKVTDFRDRPAVNINCWPGGEWDLSADVFHFLVEHLSVTDGSKKLQEIFAEFAEGEDQKDGCWLENMEAFVAELVDGGILEGTDLEHAEFDSCGTINTYNGESSLSQVLQFSYAMGDTNVILLQIHGGCDVRGGYTAPRVFEFDLEDMLCHDRDFSARCGCDTFDTDDGGYHWYPVYDQKTKTEPGDHWKSREVDGEKAVRCSECGEVVEFWNCAGSGEVA